MNKRVGTLVAAIVLVSSAEVGIGAQTLPPQPLPCRTPSWSWSTRPCRRPVPPQPVPPVPPGPRR